MEEAFNTIYDPKTMEPHSIFSNEGKLLLKALVSSSMSGGSNIHSLLAEQTGKSPGDLKKCCDYFSDIIRKDRCKEDVQNFMPKGLVSKKKMKEFDNCRIEYEMSLRKLLETKLYLFVDLIKNKYIKIDFDNKFFLEFFKKGYSLWSSIRKFFREIYGDNLEKQKQYVGYKPAEHDLWETYPHEVPKLIQAFNYLIEINASFHNRFNHIDSATQIDYINPLIEAIQKLGLGEDIDEYKEYVDKYIRVEENSLFFKEIKSEIKDKLKNFKLFDIKSQVEV